MKLNVKKDNLRSAAFITLSLILMAGSLYVGLVKGRTDDNTAQTDNASYGIEDLVTGEDLNDNDSADADTDEIIVNSDTVPEDNDDETLTDDSYDETAEQVAGTDGTKEIILHRPVSKDKIVMDYSFDTQPVYSKTFGEYRSDHTGVDYAAKEGEEVFAAAQGTVSEIYEDEKLGITVVVSHDGYETRYSNLHRAVLVSAGDGVNTDTVLGRVGNTAVYESGEDSHVHFSLYVDGKCTDPKGYID